MKSSPVTRPSKCVAVQKKTRQTKFSHQGDLVVFFPPAGSKRRRFPDLFSCPLILYLVFCCFRQSSGCSLVNAALSSSLVRSKAFISADEQQWTRAFLNSRDLSYQNRQVSFCAAVPSFLSIASLFSLYLLSWVWGVYRLYAASGEKSCEVCPWWM